MFTGEVYIRVRYKETDAMGVVHHSNYVNYYEVARTEILRTMGTTYRDLEQAGIMLPVLEVTMKFHTPARYDDLLRVEISLPELPTVRMKFHHRIFNQHDELVNEGTVLLAYMKSDTRRACRAPEWFLDYFREHYPN